MPKPPYMPFYVGDWRKSLDVQSLPYSERGIWFEMLCLMHNSPQRGELILSSGEPMADDEVARLLGLAKQDFTKALGTLLRSGVTERNEHGALINRRMVRERLISESKKRAGTAGASSRWGSKAIAELMGGLDNEICFWKNASREELKKIREAIDQWQEYRQTRAEAPKDWLLYWRKQFEFLTKYSALVAVEIINASIRNNWQGLFPPKHSPASKANGKPALWEQIKATESVIEGVSRELRAIPSISPSVFPEEAAAAEARRKPLRERKARLIEQLGRLKAQQAGEHE